MVTSGGALMNGLVTIFGLATYYLGTHDCMQVLPIDTYALIEDSGAHSVSKLLFERRHLRFRLSECLSECLSAKKNFVAHIKKIFL